MLTYSVRALENSLVDSSGIFFSRRRSAVLIHSIRHTAAGNLSDFGNTD